MIILAKPKEFLLVVKDETTNEIIYEHRCCNLTHFECVKFLLKKLKEGKPVETQLLKPLSN
jgi:hypothetical protein